MSKTYKLSIINYKVRCINIPCKQKKNGVIK